MQSSPFLPVWVWYFDWILAHKTGDIVVLDRGLDVGLEASLADPCAAEDLGIVQREVTECAFHAGVDV